MGKLKAALLALLFALPAQAGFFGPMINTGLTSTFTATQFFSPSLIVGTGAQRSTFSVTGLNLFYGIVASSATFGTGANLSTFSAAGVLTLAADLAVSEGGTGAGTFTDGGILFGNGTSAIGATGVLTNGQLLIGDGTTAPTAATLTGNPAIVVTNGAGSITFSADSSSVTLLGPSIGLTSEVTGTLPVANGGTGAATLTDGGILFGAGTGAITNSGVLSNGQLLIGDGTTAPTAATLTGTSAEVDISNGAGSVTIGLPATVGITTALGVNDMTPDAELEVVSNVDQTAYVLAVSSQSDVLGNILAVLGNGNIGIGVIGLPAQKFEISSGTFLMNGDSLAFNMQGNSANISNTWTSGNAANYVELGMGAGTGSNHGIGVNDSGTQLNGNASAGDLVMRTITASKKIVMAYNPTGRLGFQYDGVNDKVTIGNTSSPLALSVVGTGISPSATFSPNLSSSTISGALSGTFTNTALGPCISGSTITLNIPIAQPIHVAFHGSMREDTLAAKIVAGILVDGAFVTGETSSKGLVSVHEHVANDNDNMSFSRIVTGLSAGSHNVCLTAFVSAGTGTIDSTDSDARLYMYMLP